MSSTQVKCPTENLKRLDIMSNVSKRFFANTGTGVLPRGKLVPAIAMKIMDTFFSLRPKTTTIHSCVKAYVILTGR